MEDNSLKEKSEVIIRLCMENIPYYGHKIRVPTKVIIVDVFSDKVISRWHLQTYSKTSKDMILSLLGTILGAYNNRTMYLSSTNITTDFQLVSTIIHEFTHDLQHRFRVRPAQRNVDYNECESEIEANQFSQKYTLKIFNLLSKEYKLKLL